MEVPMPRRQDAENGCRTWTCQCREGRTPRAAVTSSGGAPEPTNSSPRFSCTRLTFSRSLFAGEAHETFYCFDGIGLARCADGMRYDARQRRRCFVSIEPFRGCVL